MPLLKGLTTSLPKMPLCKSNTCLKGSAKELTALGLCLNRALDWAGGVLF
ncbi:hypothetical protein HHE02_10300 [Helicobacter heilmannii]|uniref:Uncharacterized protein n=1 Tax=Helicobacter heilmannii TaxID=35817 RepID=A0A0K2XFK6_HELHE|nr:hypothetical protein BN341_16480 [Helicobacter heilmannii ASB1.4]CRF46126.1 hypothetical protein HHE014_11160 [Helicobacter heilmannii]CRF47735.1 hypothetical protein HHE02_10300 [Helicobacter heilmannii]CRF49247.1 hypothetical protein HHE03_08460 [Helicobacter heilmannii]CRF50827.1 hypothetical protein HHE06_06800 [Helicobacter heilmannii]